MAEASFGPVSGSGSSIARINGGADSIVAVFEEMTTASASLRSVSSSLTGYQRHLLLAQLANITSAPPRIPLLVPWWGAAMLNCAARVGKLHVSATKTQAQAALLATGMARAQQAYASLELEIARQFNEVNKYPALLRAGSALIAGERPTGADTQTVIENSPAYVGDLIYLASPAVFIIGSATLSPAVGLALSNITRTVGLALPKLRHKRYGGLFDTSVAERLYPSIVNIAGPALQLDVQPVTVSSLGPAQQQQLTPDFAGLLGLVSNNQGDDAGSITISTTIGADGTTHAFVGLPGTEGASATDASGKTSPFGLNGLAEGTTLGSQHITAGVMAALDEVGVPAGATVSLIGYSQGGLHAVNIATDQRFAQKYKPGMIVTAGSPVAQSAAKLPASTKTLHLEHRDDPVPGLDGQANPHSINRITVELSGYGVTPPEGTTFGRGHSFENYRERIAALQDSSPQTLREHQASLSIALGQSTIAHNQGTAQGPSGPVTVETHKVTLRHAQSPAG